MAAALIIAATVIFVIICAYLGDQSNEEERLKQTKFENLNDQEKNLYYLQKIANDVSSIKIVVLVAVVVYVIDFIMKYFLN